MLHTTRSEKDRVNKGDSDSKENLVRLQRKGPYYYIFITLTYFKKESCSIPCDQREVQSDSATPGFVKVRTAAQNIRRSLTRFKL